MFQLFSSSATVLIFSAWQMKWLFHETQTFPLSPLPQDQNSKLMVNVFIPQIESITFSCSSHIPCNGVVLGDCNFTRILSLFSLATSHAYSSSSTLVSLYSAKHWVRLRQINRRTRKRFTIFREVGTEETDPTESTLNTRLILCHS